MLTLSFKRIAATTAFSLTLLCSPSLPAQPQESASAGKTPVFSVLSVKPNKLEDTRPSFTFKPDGLSIRKYAPLWLLISAYDLVEERRVIGWPSWMLNEFFDIEAKVDEADVAELAKLTKEQQLLLLQQVFESRFNLKFHYESRDFKIFELIVAKGGPIQLKPTVFTDSNIKSIGRFHMKYEDISMPEFCLNSLSTEAQALVVDKTGLTGRYDFTLHWSRPDEMVNGAPSDQPLIFTAVQEQLGLKMVPAVAPTRVMVIDHIERPSGN